MDGSSGSEQTPSPAERQVLVVGDGLAGLATAAFLHRDALSPVIVTAGDDARDDRTIVLWRSAVSLFAELGVADDLRAAGHPVDQWQFRRTDGGSTERLTGDGDDPPALVVDRDTLRRRLRERLPSTHVRLSKTPRRLVTADDYGLRVDFADGVRERFDAVVGADGLDSWVRAAGGAQSPETPAAWGTTEWRVSMDGFAATDAPSAVVDVWTPTATLSCYPSGRARLVTPAHDDRAVARRVAAEQLDGVVDALDPAGGCSPSVPDDPTRHRWTGSDCWAAGRVGLVGAAARSLPPTLPLGPSLAVEDAYALAAALTSRDGVTPALDRYARNRRHRLRTLDRVVPICTPPSAARSGADAVRTVRSLRTAALRSFFVAPEPTVSVDLPAVTDVADAAGDT